jgi:hypothetical protein
MMVDFIDQPARLTDDEAARCKATIEKFFELPGVYVVVVHDPRSGSFELVAAVADAETAASMANTFGSIGSRLNAIVAYVEMNRRQNTASKGEA